MEEEPISAKNTGWIQFVRNINYFLLTHPFKGSSRLGSLVAKLLTPKPKGPTLVQTRHGFDIICMDPINDRGVERQLYLYGTYEAGTLSIMEKCLRKGDIFIDVGANIGLMSIFASQIVGSNGKIYSFEPEPETFAILKKNIEINKIENIYIYNFALGDKKSKAFIYTNPYAGRGSASLIKPVDQKDSKKYEVSIETLDDFISTHDIKKVRMLKIDVEGWELNVLKGADRLLKSSQAPIISIEYSKFTQAKGGKLLDLYYYILSINNYHIYKLRKGKEIPSRLVKIRNKIDLQITIIYSVSFLLI